MEARKKIIYNCVLRYFDKIEFFYSSIQFFLLLGRQRSSEQKSINCLFYCIIICVLKLVVKRGCEGEDISNLNIKFEYTKVSSFFCTLFVQFVKLCKYFNFFFQSVLVNGGVGWSVSEGSEWFSSRIMFIMNFIYKQKM